MDITESSIEKLSITTEEWEEQAEKGLITTTTTAISKLIFEDVNPESQSSPIGNKTKAEWLKDLHYLSDIVYDFINEEHLSWNHAQELSKLAFQRLNSLIEVCTIWEDFNQTEQTQQATKLLQMIESLSVKLNLEQEIKNSDSVTLNLKFGSILLKSVKIPLLEDTEKIATFNFNGEVIIEIPLAALNRSDSKALTVVLVNKLPSYMSATSEGLIINSKLISVNLGQTNKSVHLKSPYKLKFM